MLAKSKRTTPAVFAGTLGASTYINAQYQAEHLVAGNARFTVSRDWPKGHLGLQPGQKITARQLKEMGFAKVRVQGVIYRAGGKSGFSHTVRL